MPKTQLTYMQYLKNHPSIIRDEYKDDLKTIFNFIVENKVNLVNAIEGHKRAPLEGVVVKLEKEYANTFERIKNMPVFPAFKQAIGRMIAYVLKPDGYVPNGRCDIRTNLSKYFKRSSFYVKENERQEMKAQYKNLINK